MKQNKQCPKCNTLIDKIGNYLICPNCDYYRKTEKAVTKERAIKNRVIKRRKFSEEKVQEIIKMYKKEGSVINISEKHGISKVYCRKLLIDAGVWIKVYKK